MLNIKNSKKRRELETVAKRKRKIIGYEFAQDLQQKAEEISQRLFPHVRLGFFKCFRSSGSASRRTVARCHGLAKIMQKAIGCSAHYAIEFISERFDKLSQEEQIKVIIHELMHIPQNFGGGFKHHNYVNSKNVEKMYKNYKKEAGLAGKKVGCTQVGRLPDNNQNYMKKKGVYA